MPSLPEPVGDAVGVDATEAGTEAEAEAEEAQSMADVAAPRAGDEAHPQAPLATGSGPTVPHLSPADCASQLATRFPALFARPQPLPLKLRIQQDVQQRAPGVFTRKALSIFLQRHTTGTAYLKALVNGTDRFDLDGQAAGTVADEHREAARAELARRRALHDERRAAERAAQRQSQDAARQAWLADQQARQARAGLLRAFETSTLTRANFCALKQVSEADLEVQLVQARAERAAQPPAPVDTRPSGRPSRDGRSPGPSDRKVPPRRHGARPPAAR